MKIHFDREKLQKLCNSKKLLTKKYDQSTALALNCLLLDLQSYPNLSEACKLRPRAIHQLKGSLKMCFAGRLPNGLRLIFEPASPFELLPDNAINRKSVTEIRILKIENYHRG